MKKYLRKIVSPVFDLLVYLLNGLSNRVRLNIALIECRFFGHVALEPEVIKFAQDRTLHSRRPRQVFLLSLPVRAPRNSREIVAKRRREFHWLPTSIVSQLTESQRRLGLEPVSIKSFGYHQLNELKHSSPSLRNRESKCRSMRKTQKVKRHLSDPFVTLTMREPSIHQLSDPLRDRSLVDFGDSIGRLRHLGIQVVRMGRGATQAIDPHLSFYDYASGEDQSLETEIEIASRSLFCLSSLTGFDALSLALRKPVFYPDAARLWYLFLGTELAYFSFPKFLDAKTRSSLCLTDLLDRGWVNFKNPEDFENAGLIVQFASPGEVANYVESMAKEALGIISRTERHNALQEDFRHILLDHAGPAVAERHGQPMARLNLDYLDTIGKSFIR